MVQSERFRAKQVSTGRRFPDESDLPPGLTCRPLRLRPERSRPAGRRWQTPPLPSAPVGQPAASGATPAGPALPAAAEPARTQTQTKLDRSHCTLQSPTFKSKLQFCAGRIKKYNHTAAAAAAAHSSYLGKQFLLLSEELLLRDAQVLQPGAGLPPLQGHRLALLQHVLHLRYVRREAETLECCGVFARDQS